jgi:hypothetical protein
MKYLFTLLFLLIIHPQIAFAQIITIGTSGDFPNLEAAENFVNAGDTLQLQSQVFSDGTQFLENLNGTALAPIVIMATNEHQSIFQGGTEAIHLINCSYVEINGLVVEQQTGNGINIDDGGDYATPSTHITIRNCIFRDMAANGNNDLLKMSGVDSFLIERCQFINGGDGGSGVDFVGCHWGTVQDCYFDDPGTSGIQNKGGTQFIRMQRNVFKNVAQRALNLGGSTGPQFFRPPLSDPISSAFEAADLEVYSNVFIGSWAPIAYVGSVRVKVYNNTFYQPENWVIRILQETTTPGFLPCGDNEFRNNIVYLSGDLTEVNIGPNTAPETFVFSHNLWYNADSGSWSPGLPVTDTDQIIDDPMFTDVANENFRIGPLSPAVGAGQFFEAPTTDFDQLFFQQPPSIGAFEGGAPVNQTQHFLHESIFEVFPNPSSSTLSLEGELYNVNVVIINQLGQEVQAYTNINLPFTMDINEFPNGLYFVLVESPLHSQLLTKKIIKKSN